MIDNPHPECLACRDLGGTTQRTGPGPCGTCGRFGIGDDHEHLREIADLMTDGTIPPTRAMADYLRALAGRLAVAPARLAGVLGRLDVSLDVNACPRCEQVLLIRGLGLEASIEEIARKVWDHDAVCRGGDTETTPTVPSSPEGAPVA